MSLEHGLDNNMSAIDPTPPTQTEESEVAACGTSFLLFV